MKKHLAIGLLTLLISLSAHAGLITLNDMQTQTVNGEDFIINFNNLLPSDGTGGSLIVHAQGDYDGGAFENLNVTLDGGLFSTGLMGGCVSGSNCQGGDASYDFITVFQPLGNLEFQKTFLLGGALLDSLLSDATISVFADNDPSVGLFQPPNFVEITIEYNMAQIPEPASIALFCIGLAGLGRSLRKRI